MTEPRPVVSETRAAVSDPRAVVSDPRAVVSDPRAVVSDPQTVVSDPQTVTTAAGGTFNNQQVTMRGAKDYSSEQPPPGTPLQSPRKGYVPRVQR